MTDKNDRLTTSAGAPVANNNHALTAGPRGPMLMQDVWFQEKLAHFDREVIPERRMHAKGSGAYGTFTVTHDVTQSVFGNFSFYSYKKACGQKKTVRGSKNSRRLSNDTPAI